MKILLLGFSKMKYMPYINFYLENIDLINNDVHVVCWNRDNKEDINLFEDKITIHSFNRVQEDQVPKTRKIGNFILYRRYVKKIINENKFDFIIVLHTLPGFLLADELLQHWKEKYIFDYRDGTYETFSLFQQCVSNLVCSSHATFISSEGFLNFFSKRCEANSVRKKIYVSHNILTDSLRHREYTKEPFNKIIRISFWGFIRDEGLNRKLIEKVSKDDRFELHFYGREQRVAINLKKYAEQLKAENIIFHGEYCPDERYDFICHTDILHNLYNNYNAMFAMTNKYYDSIIFRIPQLCIPSSQMGKQIRKYGIGLECDPSEEDFCDKVYDYFCNINMNVFARACDIELERILIEYQNGCERIKSVFNEVK